ncbi:ESPR-type extended signal peptide-containing protein, partial [Paraburkholderia sp. J63]|uniref:ESPR-type extended signal peptide-containing protein n=1 Tax=Paraburkholderia sp. J63 TaxID=2805434 RepID=UPI002ABD6903
MNKTYRSIWNKHTGTYVAAAETTRTRSKGAQGSSVAAAAAAVTSLLAVGGMLPNTAFASATGHGACANGATVGGPVSNGDCTNTGGNSSVAIGSGSAQGTGSGALMFPTITSPSLSDDNGLLRITNVASTDAATVGQPGNPAVTTLAAVSSPASNTQTGLQAVNSQLGAVSAVSDSTNNPWIDVAGPADGSQPAYATPLTGSVAIGQAATATVGAGVAIGASAVSTGTGAVSVGSGSTASGNGSFAMGTATLA